jgi:hypothetical protein
VSGLSQIYAWCRNYHAYRILRSEKNHANSIQPKRCLIFFQTFKILVDNAQVAESPVQPIEFLTDRTVSFRDPSRQDYEPFQVKIVVEKSQVFPCRVLFLYSLRCVYMSHAILGPGELIKYYTFCVYNLCAVNLIHFERDKRLKRDIISKTKEGRLLCVRLL